MKSRWLCSLSLVLLLVAAGSCGSRETRRLILITLDTTRADRLGCYGYAGGTTPNLDRLAARAVRFQDAVAHQPMTLPSHCSIFTGRYPLGHGVRDNAGFRLPDEMETLAEVLAAAGYRTSAFIAAKVLADKFGVAQGFQDFDQAIPLEAGERDAKTVVDAATAWIGQHAGESFFTWIHFYEPHNPYAPPEPYRERFAEAYDGEIAYMDSQIGRLLDFVEAQDLFDESAIIVVGDHGEGLGQHDEPGHGYFTYDSTLRVPFLVKPPGAARPAAIEDQVRLVDVMPTALSLLDVDIPSDIDGTDLGPLLRGERASPDAHSYGESYEPYYRHGFSPVRTVRTGKFKLIESPEPELYDLRADPDETRDLSAEQPAQVVALRAELERIIETSSVDLDATMTLDSETLEELAALGYVGGLRQQSLPQTAQAALPSARENHRHHLTLIRVSSLIDSEDLETAQRDLTPVLQQFPEMSEALDLQSKIYFKKKMFPESTAILQRLAEADPSNTIVLQKLGLALAVQGDARGAVAAFQRVVHLAPTDSEARQNLWKLYHSIGQDELALTDIRAMTQQDPSRGYAWLWLARFESPRGDPAEVEAAYRKAAADPQTAYEAYLGLGRFYRDRGRLAEAAQTLERSLEHNDKPIEALRSLASLSYGTGDKQAARRWLERARDLAPQDAELRSQLARLTAELGG